MTRACFIFIALLLFVPQSVLAQSDPLGAYSPPPMFGEAPQNAPRDTTPRTIQKSIPTTSRSALPKSQILAPARFSDYNESRRIAVSKEDVPTPPRKPNNVPPALTQSDLTARASNKANAIAMSVDTTKIIAPRITRNQVRDVTPQPSLEGNLKDLNAHDVLATLSEQRMATQQITDKVLAAQPMVINYTQNQLELDAGAKAQLDQIAVSRLLNTDKIVTLLSYASADSSFSNNQSNSDKRRALMRAVHVQDYLANKGVSPARIIIKAMGADTDKSPKNRVEFSFSGS